MILFPNAKINLGLFVTEKRVDKFHNIETIFYPIPLCDSLEIVDCVGEQKMSSLQIHGMSIDGNVEENLVFKAYNLLKNDFSLPNIQMNLLKNIPFGAGLGGGSSDATFMLKALNEKFSLQLSNEKLEDYARKIGSDCAFFVKNKPVFAYEKGDHFEAINLNLKGYQLLLICPPIHVNTKSAYQDISPKKTEFDLRNLSEIPIDEWKLFLKNDFEKTVFSQHQILSDIKQKLYEFGAVYAAMSGSGSAIFGLFRRSWLNEIPLEEIRNFLDSKFQNCAVFSLKL